MSLAEKMTKPPAREKVVADCCALIDAEVKSKTGLSGAAVKMGYGVVKAVKPKFVTEVVDSALERALEIAERLAALPPLAVSLTKQAIDAAADAPREAGLLIERLAYAVLSQTERQ